MNLRLKPKRIEPIWIEQIENGIENNYVTKSVKY